MTCPRIFGGIAGQMVDAVASVQGVTPDLPTSILLSTLTTMIGGRLEVRRANKHPYPINLWTAGIAPPGVGKSPIFRYLTEPIMGIERETKEASKSEIAKYEAELHLATEALKDAKRGTNKRVLVEAQLEYNQLRDHPVVAPRLLAGNLTPEMLIKVMYQQGERMSILSPEGDVLRSVLGLRYGDGNIDGQTDFARNAFGAEPYTYDRKSNGESFSFVRPCLQIGIFIQPDLAGRLFKPLLASGFSHRFLYFSQAPFSSEPGKAPTRKQELQWEKFLRNIYDTYYKSPSVVVLSLTEEAEAEMIKIEAKAREMREKHYKSTALASYYAKSEDLIIRVAAVIALTKNLGKIDVDCINGAKTLYKYSLSCFQRIFGFDGHDEALDDGIRIRNSLFDDWNKLQAKQWVSTTDFQNSYWKKWDVARLQPALSWLLENNYLKQMECKDMGGRKSVRMCPNWEFIAKESTKIEKEEK